MKLTFSQNVKIITHTNEKIRLTLMHLNTNIQTFVALDLHPHIDQ